MDENCKNSRPELLAPAGDMDCLKMAVSCGADAVYLGLRRFSARAGAKNFDEMQLQEAVDYCHLHGVKLYVTLNTLVFDREFDALCRAVEFVDRAGVDAAIVQDLGLVAYIRKIAPHLALHASTQMTIHSASGVKALEALGFRRVVLARELSGRQIREISETTHAQLEVFVHGALCVCYSGQCLMSSFLGGRSANRGRCAQPCRLAFTAGKQSGKTLLSLKDNCLLPHLEELAQDGVQSLKIEGRMKGPDYVGQVVSIYRKYLDSGEKPSEEDRACLMSAFDRGGYTDGYYTGHTGRTMFCFDKPENPYTRQVPFVAPPERKVSLRIGYRLQAGAPVCLWAEDGEGNRARVESDFLAERAQKTPTGEGRIRQQLLKLGGTIYQCKEISGECGEDVFIPVGALNELRRMLLCRMDEARIAAARALREKRNPGGDGRQEGLCFFVSDRPYASQCHKGADLQAGFSVEVSCAAQLRTLMDYPAVRFYIPVEMLREKELQLLLDQVGRDRVCAILPRVAQEKELTQAQDLLRGCGVQQVAVGNIGQVEAFSHCVLHGDFGLNITNREALAAYARMGLSSAALSYEVSARVAEEIAGEIATEYLVYGRVPLMLLENCLYETLGVCTRPSALSASGCAALKNEEGLSLRDRKGMAFPIRRAGLSCRSELLNAVPVYLADRPEDLRSLRGDLLRLRFTDEDADLCRALADAYFYGKDAVGPASPVVNFTRGYFYKSLE